MGGGSYTLGKDEMIGASIGASAGMLAGGETEIMAGAIIGGMAAKHVREVCSRYDIREQASDVAESYGFDDILR